MVRGVLDGRFLHFDMNHMPGYYAASAAVLAVVGDAVIAARAVSLVGGLVALALSVTLAERLGGRVAAALAAAFLLFQPEFALYSASSLREPLYAAFVLAALLAAGRERLVLAGVCAGAAFLVRFDGALVLGPVLALHALGRPNLRAKRLVSALGPMALAIVGWAVYTRIDHGTFAFWSHAVAVNVETGLGEEAGSALDWWGRGLAVAGSLTGWTLPWRLGWGLWIGLWLALWKTPWRRHGLARSSAVLAVCMVGLWAGIGLVGQHSPEHNLYWKWLCPIVPVLVPLGAAALARAHGAWGDWIGRRGATALLSLVVVQAWFSHARETRRQIEISDRWYRPQLELALWIEQDVPEDVPLLVDNIPACWLNRRHHDRQLTSWFDVPSTPGDPDAFARWIVSERIGWVLWFREDWTQAPRVAPFLSRGGLWSTPTVSLVETDREDGYGWILFEVVHLDSASGP